MVVLAACDGHATAPSASASASSPSTSTSTSTSQTESVSPSTARVGFVGLPPEGAHPSTPPSGELVLSFNGFGEPNGRVRVDLYVYADGTMIWQKWTYLSAPVDVPEGANEFASGYLEQRLTTDGVALLRSRILSTGLFDRDRQLRAGGHHRPLTIGVRNGDRVVFVSASHAAKRYPKETPAQARAIVRLDTLLADLTAWLPTTAWADREIRAYVPARYQAGFDRRVPSPDELPPPADELLFDDCEVLTIAEARAISDALENEALEDPGVRPSLTSDGQLGYEIGVKRYPAALHFWAVLPDQDSFPGYRKGWRGNC
jgi:hypothetical protein